MEALAFDQASHQHACVGAVSTTTTSVSNSLISIDSAPSEELFDSLLLSHKKAVGSTSSSTSSSPRSLGSNSEDDLKSTASTLCSPAAKSNRSQFRLDREREWVQVYEDNKNVMAGFASDNIVSAADYYEAVCDSRPDQVFVVAVASGRSYTYSETDSLANQVAAWGIQQGWVAGDAVALAMENCPRFLQVWIGLAKIGVTVACINTNISGEVLVHAIQVAKCRAAIVSLQQSSKWESLHYIVPITISAGSSFDTLDLARSPSSSSSPLLLESLLCSPCSSFSCAPRPDRALRSTIKGTDPLFYIYTSGTTGFSKAALFSHTRFIGAGVTWSRAMRLTSEDVYYVTLPLYHGNGGVVAVSAVLRSGCRLILREKFSVSNFLPDIRRFGCTATIYIGEMWRYMHNSPSKPDDAENTLRVAAGNGLRGDIWRAVCDRFGISLIVEHYGQTEMPSAHPMINHYNVIGSCGYIPPRVRGGLGTECLIKFDVDRGQPIRDENTGFCITCGPGEPGEAIARLSTPYSGYTSAEAAQKAVYRDVFEKGDLWYHSGDMLSCDKDGFFFFVDRVGDTFRWKGENVATGEVCEAIGSFPGVSEANVYGVAIPGTEGRAGMASLHVGDISGETSPSSPSHEGVIDLAALYTHVSKRLPGYARPLFLRIRYGGEENEKTSTFKFRKTRYQQQGYSISACAPDLVYFRDDAASSYVLMDEDMVAKINSGVIRV